MLKDEPFGGGIAPAIDWATRSHLTRLSSPRTNDNEQPIYGLCRFLAASAMLCTVATTTANAGQNEAFTISAAMHGDNEWVCRAETIHRRGWFIRCENLSDALAYDAAPYNTPDIGQGRLIPLYGAPYADSNLTQLASAALCSGESRCRIVMTAN